MGKSRILCPLKVLEFLHPNFITSIHPVYSSASVFYGSCFVCGCFLFSARADTNHSHRDQTEKWYLPILDPIFGDEGIWDSSTLTFCLELTPAGMQRRASDDGSDEAARDISWSHKPWSRERSCIVCDVKTKIYPKGPVQEKSGQEKGGSVNTDKENQASCRAHHVFHPVC